MDEKEKLARAKKMVVALTGFYVHLAVFAVVLVLLFAINATSSGQWWVQWVFLGWGAFVLGHGISISTDVSSSVRAWQARKARELADKM
jgi:2TM domain